MCETESDFEFADINCINCVEDNSIEEIQVAAQEIIKKNSLKSSFHKVKDSKISKKSHGDINKIQQTLMRNTDSLL